MSAIMPDAQILSRAGEPRKIATARVSAAFFPMLGVEPQIGRNFLDREDQPGQGAVAIVTNGLWTERFNRDPGIIGKPIYLDGNPYVVTGVLPSTFRVPATEASTLVSLAKDTTVFRPAAVDLSQIDLMGEFNDQVLARLKPGVSETQAQSELNVIQAAIAKQLPEPMHLAAQVTPLVEEVTGRVRTGLIVLLASIGAVLLIVCANLANLALARAVARNRDVSIRIALGANRWQMLRQMLTESVLTSIAGGVLGVALAWGGLHLLLHYAPVDLPRIAEIAIDGRVLAFAFGLAALAGIVFGSVPAWQASKADPQTALRAASHNVTDGRRGVRLREALVSLEVGLGALLVIASGLLVLSFVRLMNVDKGFQPEKLIAAEVNLPEASYQKREDRETFYRQLISKMQSIPGVDSVGIISRLPLSGETWVSLVIRESDKGPVFKQPTANYRFISPGYFRTMGIPMIRGHVFDEIDRKQNYVVVSEKVAKRIWPGEDPIGKRFSQGDDKEPLFVVAGVVKDVRTAIASEPVLMVYTPYWYRTSTAMTVVLRTSQEPSAVASSLRSAIWSLNPETAIANVRTMDKVVTASVAQRRFQMYLLTGFAAFALLLASLGVFGVVSWSVARRRNEIGVRMALGARSLDVNRIVIRQGMLPVVAGLAVGIVAALALGNILSSLLYEVSARDPMVFGGVTLLLLIVSLLACYLPSRRATRIDPIEALRYE
jgi:putative ABC transport system permease protein